MATENLAPIYPPNFEAETLLIMSPADEHPSSPSPAGSFSEFMTGLLQSLLSNENQLGCPFTREFCVALLRTDDVGYGNEGNEEPFSEKGVPKYPLYKYIGRGLSEWISTGKFSRTMEPMEGISEDEGTSAKIEGWTKKVVEIGVHLKEDVKRYSTFEEMLEIEGLSSVLPEVTTIKEGVQVYRKFYSEAREKEAGVVGIHVQHRVNPRQPFELLYDILKELHVEGIRALLGMRSTMGSITDTLPPPTSMLLSAFSIVNNETVPGSKLTVGARALSKHVHRCSNGWWGMFTGSEPAKNELSFLKLQNMIEDAIWMNVHVVPVPVFEIRVRGGYGARWSLDGSQFRGFLEPPMEEGYLHKWRH
ncbi:hypothetical protein AXG93_2543s1030 [Marchantia polymorpha subsp. ruderalis]|uniref:Uncharacterized protein n=1 Tax=Marchantia polymorpha subsp. ruderalis TaxID=1480154 RepID=A0A176VKT9_MARPO|nr:hypothetical protein AXG93_2543s1030 [Marchantia polymorpha subsp. ruderalis]